MAREMGEEERRGEVEVSRGYTAVIGNIFLFFSFSYFAAT